MSHESLAVNADQLGQVLKGVRKSLSLTQEQVGQKIGCHQKEVSKMENRLGRTSVERLFRLLSALDLELVIRPRENQSEAAW